MENIGVGMPFSDLGQTRVYPSFSDLSAERYPVGLMDLLGVHQGISRYTLIHTPPMHLPATPNSSSISSASSEAVTGEEKKRDDEEDEEEEEDKHQHQRNKR